MTESLEGDGNPPFNPFDSSRVTIAYRKHYDYGRAGQLRKRLKGVERSVNFEDMTIAEALLYNCWLLLIFHGLGKGASSSIEY